MIKIKKIRKENLSKKYQLGGQINPKYFLFFDCKITFLSYSEYSKYSQRMDRMDSLYFLKFLSRG